MYFKNKLILEQQLITSMWNIGDLSYKNTHFQKLGNLILTGSTTGHTLGPRGFLALGGAEGTNERWGKAERERTSNRTRCESHFHVPLIDSYFYWIIGHRFARYGFPHVKWDLSYLSLYCFFFPCKMLADNSIQKTPTKVIKPSDLCRVCRCSPAVVGREKCNLFSSKNSTASPDKHDADSPLQLTPAPLYVNYYGIPAVKSLVI